VLRLRLRYFNPCGGKVVEGALSDSHENRFFLNFLCTLFNMALSAVPQIPLCQRMLEPNPVRMQLWHWQTEVQTTRLDLIHLSARSHPQTWL
jgi:hypothetical protein